MAEQVFTWLLEKGASILSDDKEEKSDILLNAIKDGDLNIVTLLIGIVSDMNKMKFEGETLLSIAAYSGHTSIVKFLVSKGADIEGTDDDGLTPLHVACREGHLEIVRFLVSEGDGDVNLQTFDGMTPLAMASKRGHVEVMKYLISKGADVEKSTDAGGTPLHWACARGLLPTANYLLYIGADANGTDQVGWTALHYATLYDMLDIIKSLLSAGADINWQDKDGTTPLHIACANDRMNVLKFLLASEVDVEKAEYNGTTVLHTACTYGHRNVVNHILLHAKGAHLVNRRDEKGQTPLHLATYFGLTSIIDMLLSRGGDLNIQTIEGYTCLHIAAGLFSSPNKVELTKTLSQVIEENPADSILPTEALMKHLVKNGAVVNVTDKAGRMPLDYIPDTFKLRVRQQLHFHGSSTGNLSGAAVSMATVLKENDDKRGALPNIGSTGAESAGSPLATLSDRVLVRLASDIPNNYLTDLGLILRFSPAQINRFESTNSRGPEITSKGTYDMLRSWYDATRKELRIPTLIGALEEAGLIRLAENHLFSLIG